MNKLNNIIGFCNDNPSWISSRYSDKMIENVQLDVKDLMQENAQLKDKVSRRNMQIKDLEKKLKSFDVSAQEYQDFKRCSD